MIRLRYETGIATLVQFLIVAFLNIGNTAVSITTTCHKDSENCLPNGLASLMLFLLVVIWYGAVWGLGYVAQDRRSHKLARLLVVVEFIILMIALFNAKHHSTVIGLITSIADFVLAAWVIYLAFNLARLKGNRARARNRSLARKRST